MNDADFASALRAIHNDVAETVVSPALRARVLAIPAERPQRPSRSWHLPSAGRRSLSSGIRLIAALAILALIGGLLVIGVGGLRTSPTSLELVTEPVEPSVDRVLGDGAGHDIGGASVRGIAIAPDGTVWMSAGADEETAKTSLWQLGTPGAHDGQGNSGLYAVATDDAWWNPGSRGLNSFDGTSWTTHSPVDGTALAATVAVDGTVWGAWFSSSSIRVARWEGDAWTVHPAELPLTSAESRDVTAGDSAICCPFYGDFLVTPSGELWLSIGVNGFGERETGGLWRLRDDEWERVQPLGVEAETRVAVGADGTLWVHLEDRVGPCPTRQPCWGVYLARLAGETWTIISEADGVPYLGGQAFVSPMKVGPDGTVWLKTGDRGVSSFDGSTWTRYLAGRSLSQKIDLDIAPDGRVWVKGSQVYLITPTSATSAETPTLGAAPDSAPTR